MTCWGDVLKRRAGQLRRCGIEVQFRPDVATCVGLEWTRRSFGESRQVATSAEPPAKKQAVLASVVNRLRHRVSGMDRKAGTVHALGDSLGTVPVLLRKIRYVRRFFICEPAPRRSWLAMTEGGRRSLRIGWVVGEAHVSPPLKGVSREERAGRGMLRGPCVQGHCQPLTRYFLNLTGGSADVAPCQDSLKDPRALNSNPTQVATSGRK